MSNAWNIENLRKIAGNPLVESFDDEDDDLSPAEKALADKADSDLKKTGVKVKHVDPDKDMSKLAKKVGGKEEKTERNQEAAEKGEASAADVEAKKEKAAAPSSNPKTAKKLERKAAAAEAEAKKEPKGEEETAKKGRKTDDASKIGQARTWLKNNAGAKRSEFLTYTDSIGMSRHHASGKLTQLRRGLNEFYMLRHPMLSSVYLAENYELGSYQWADAYSPLDPLVFETETDAREAAAFMSDWKSLQTVIEHFVAEAEDEKEEPADKDALKKVGVAKAWLRDHATTSREAFAAHCKEAYGWAALTANSYYDAFKKPAAEVSSKD
jgi:hypothetical protein